MKIKVEGGFVEVHQNENLSVGISIGCEHFNSDGTRKDTVVNAVTLSQEQFLLLFQSFLIKNNEYLVD